MPSQPLLCLGIESTAHTFSVGIVNQQGEILGLASDSFTPSRGGLKPAEVVEHHYLIFDQMVNSALQQAKIVPQDLDLIAFSQGPGLGPCLRVGAAVARSLSLKLHIPLVGVNHCIAHVEIGRKLCGSDDPITLYVSGGNTIVSAFESNHYQVFGETIDIPIGNLLDMVAREIGIPHPGGPVLEKLAKKGKNYIPMPYAVKGMDLSFSGLFSYIRKYLQDLTPAEKDKILPDVIFSLQETAFSMLTEVVERAIAHTQKKSILLTGGVAANKRLQTMVKTICTQHGVDFHFVPLRVAGDNGAMIAWTGILRFQSAGEFSIPDTKIRPKWRMDEVSIPWRSSDNASTSNSYLYSSSPFINTPTPNKSDNSLTYSFYLNQLQNDLNITDKTNLNPLILQMLENSFGSPHLGAEAYLIPTLWFEKPAMMKFRVAKHSRIPPIDSHIRFQRTVSEARILIALQNEDIVIPKIYDILPNDALIIMEFIEGKTLKEIIPALSNSKLSQYCTVVGEKLALMHNISISHGDLTTSNIVITPHNDLVLIDFGLGSSDIGLEEKAMDLHLFKRVLQSSHGSFFVPMWSAFLHGYRQVIKSSFAEIEDRVAKIELRGRYIAKDMR
ncbi:MAG: bifunctional N(6)-L-threonylcarbamoyladenine synthase/serine/threonine protein kinase [Promethearchaeota archaeon]